MEGLFGVVVAVGGREKPIVVLVGNVDHPLDRQQHGVAAAAVFLVARFAPPSLSQERRQQL